MNKYFAPVILLSLATALQAAAPETLSDVPPPREPLLQRMPDRVSWVITTYNSDRERAREAFFDPEKAAKREKSDQTPFMSSPRSITVAKLNPTTYREKITWADGVAAEKWIENNVQLREARQAGRLMRIPAGYTEDSSDYSRSDFEDLEWIGLDNYVGAQDVAGRKVHVFSTPNEKRRPTPRERAFQAEFGSPLLDQKATSTAYLDITTLRPILVDNGTTVRMFEYGATPASDLIMPEKFTTAFASLKQNLKPTAAKP